MPNHLDAMPLQDVSIRYTLEFSKSFIDSLLASSECTTSSSICHVTNSGTKFRSAHHTQQNEAIVDTYTRVKCELKLFVVNSLDSSELLVCFCQAKKQPNL